MAEKDDDKKVIRVSSFTASLACLNQIGAADMTDLLLILAASLRLPSQSISTLQGRTRW